jgi:hypothetical protein
MRNLSRVFTATALAGVVGAGALAFSAPAGAQMVRDRFVARHPVTHSRVVVRDRFHRPFVRDRFRIGVGFYGYPAYGYPYADDYAYPYDDGYYGSYSCDPYSSYYDPDDCY